jgi:hypothetical protein
MLAGALFCLMQASKGWPLVTSLGFNTLLIVLFVAFIIRRDLPLSSLPVIGKKFKN